MPLTTRQIITAARRYGFDPRSRTVTELVTQAESYHGRLANKGAVYWATDADGIYQADRLLDGYLSETARCNQADAASYRDFCDAAYGA